jgi:hypothetical protein
VNAPLLTVSKHATTASVTCARPGVYAVESVLSVVLQSPRRSKYSYKMIDFLFGYFLLDVAFSGQLTYFLHWVWKDGIHPLLTGFV